MVLPITWGQNYGSGWGPVIAINDKPNGVNINERCSSTYTDDLIKAVVEHQADMGITYDGDADRCIIVDERGNELDGDYILLICGLDAYRSGELTPQYCGHSNEQHWTGHCVTAGKYNHCQL